MQKKSGILMIILAATILTGCGMGRQGEIAANGSSAAPSSTMGSASATRTGSANTSVQTTAMMTETTKVTSQKLDKLNVELLNKLDNTKYGWGLKLNSEHKTPGISDAVRKLLDGNHGLWIGNTSEKAVYLTFDEGYENGYTAKILDTLKKNDVKSLFFVTGPYIRKNPDLVKRMLDEGHQVGNHTINHPSLPAVDNATLEKELLGLEKEFQAQFGKGFKYMRPPSGEYSQRVLAAAWQLGYKTVFWSFAYRDWEVDKQQGADYAYKSVMDNLHNGAVVLLHAVSKDNAEALDRIITGIRAAGYEIKPFDL